MATDDNDNEKPKRRFVLPEDTRDPGTRPGAPDRGTGKQKLQQRLGTGRGSVQSGPDDGSGATGRKSRFDAAGPARLANFTTSDDQPDDKIGGSVRKIGGVARDKIGGVARDKIGGRVAKIGGAAADKIDGRVKKQASETRRRKIAEYGKE